jgi:hypothetical protein
MALVKISPPVDLINFVTEASASSERSPTETLAPSDESSFTHSRPIPEAPPVMAITLPVRFGPDRVVILGFL